MEEAPGTDLHGSLRATFKGIGAIVAPTSLVTALLYYFGWVRTNVEAEQLGFDESMLGYSIPDYLLNSMSSMFGPLLVGLLAALVGLAFHGLVTMGAARLGAADDGSSGDRARRLIGALAAIVATVGLMAALLGLISTQVERPSDALYVGGPVAVTLGIVFVLYAASLCWRYLVRRSSYAAIASSGSYNLAVTATLVMLLLLSLFWNVSHYAVVKGHDLAATVEAAIPTFPDVRVFSREPLYLQPPVKETKLAIDSAGYSQVYENLKLLFEAGGNYFLRPSDTNVPLNIVLPIGPDIRVELYRS